MVKIPTDEQEDRLASIRDELKTFRPENVREVALVSDLKFCLALVEDLWADRDAWRARSSNSYRVRESNRRG